jgi:hypothetical protein
MATFPLKIALENQPEWSFENIDALTKWLAAEEKAWRWVNPDSSSQVIDLYKQKFTRLDSLISEYKTQPHPDRLRGVAHELTRSFAYPYLMSSSPEGRFLAALATDRGNTAASAALAHLTRQPFAVSNSLAVSEGVCRAVCFEMGISKDAKPERDALNALLGELRTTADSSKDAHATLTRESERILATTDEAAKASLKRLDQVMKGHSQSLDSVREEYGRDREGFKAAFGEFLETSGKAMKTLEDVYDKKMGLSAPVSYWTERQAQHKKQARFFGVIWGVMLVVGGVSLALTVAYLFGTDTIPHWKLGVVAVLFALYLWATRIFARLFLGNLHLAMDASERVVMAQTYLSLAREGNASDDDRTLMLGALFRHAATGIVTDDASPSTPLEIVSRMLSGGK